MAHTGEMTLFDAIVLAGGRSRRMNGADKALIQVAGRTLLERAIEAVGEAAAVVVVGPPRPARFEVTWVQEEPPGGGPVAALEAGLEPTGNDLVAVLAVDHPAVTGQVVDRLLGAVESGTEDGAVVADESGRAQPLVGVYRRGSLMRRLNSMTSTHGASVRELLEDLSLVLVPDPRAARDCDTWEDVEAATAAVEGKERTGGR